jgi:hypothetical protein
MGWHCHPKPKAALVTAAQETTSLSARGGQAMASETTKQPQEIYARLDQVFSVVQLTACPFLRVQRILERYLLIRAQPIKQWYGCHERLEIKKIERICGT